MNHEEVELEFLRIGDFNTAHQNFEEAEELWEPISLNKAKGFINSNYEVLSMTRPLDTIYFMQLDSVLDRIIEGGRSVELLKGVVRKKTLLDKCPRCGSNIMEEPSLSRRDGTSIICTICGGTEAYEDMLDIRGD